MKRVAVWLLYFGVALGVRAQSPDAEFLQVYSVMQQGETFERSGQPSDAMDRFQTAQRELQKFAKAYPNWNEKLIKFRLSYLAGKIGSLTMKKVEPSPGGAIPGATVPRVDASAPQAIGLSSSDRERLERAESRVAEAEAKADRALRTADEATARANRADERTDSADARPDSHLLAVILQQRACHQRVDAEGEPTSEKTQDESD